MRRWRENRPRLVNQETGAVLRDATSSESRADFEARKNKKRLTVLADGVKHEVVPDRDIMRQEFLDLFGECQLRRSNGTFLAMIRDPNVKRPDPKKTKVAPEPEQCECRDWGNPHPGKHHKVCPWNRYAPAHQRGDIVAPTRVHKQRMPADTTQMTVVTDEVNRPVQSPNKIVIPSPEECVCRDWLKPPQADPNQHHPICEWHDRWLKKVKGLEGMFVIDLDSGDALRPATNDEIDEAQRNEQEDGAGIITIGNKQYAVAEHKPKVTAPSDVQIIEQELGRPISTAETIIEETSPSPVPPNMSNKLYIFDPETAHPMRVATEEEIEQAEPDEDGMLRIQIGTKRWIIAAPGYKPPVAPSSDNEPKPEPLEKASSTEPVTTDP